jgi:hypothetical protein
VSPRYTSSDNPHSESNLKALKYRPEFAERLDDIEHAHCSQFFDWYNQDRQFGRELTTPATAIAAGRGSYTPPAPVSSTPPTSGIRRGSHTPRAHPARLPMPA